MKKERPLIRYEKLSKEDLVDYCRVYWRRIHNDEELFNEIYKDIEKLKEENKKLKEKYERLEIHCNNLRQIIEDRKEENKKLKETIKDHQLYEEKLEHRIIEFEELLHWE